MAEPDLRELTGEGLVPDADMLFAAYGRNRARLLRFLSRRLGCRATAEDLAQDIWFKLARVRGPVRDPSAFLFQIAANLVRDHAKVERRRAELLNQAMDILWREEDVVTPEHHLVAADALASMDKAIAALPPLSRQIFVLVYFDGLTQGEAAKRLGFSRVTVNHHVRRVLDRLAEVRAGLADEPHRMLNSMRCRIV
ncbi:MAG: RNA polymerase sigma factor [Rhizomicrobium sp.]